MDRRKTACRSGKNYFMNSIVFTPFIQKKDEKIVFFQK